MRLWIDGQCLQTASRLRGIGRYVTELLRAIAEYHSDAELLISFNAAMPEEALLAREAVCGFLDPKNIHVWHGAIMAGEAVEGYTPERRMSELAIAHHVNCLAPDVALSASPFEGAHNPAVPLLPGRGCGVPAVSIFYDAIPHRYKAIYLPTNLMESYYQRRLAIYPKFTDNLCISEFSKSELESIHGVIKAENIGAGISRDFAKIEKYSSNISDDLGKYALYVGALDWRKNVKTLVNAFIHIDRTLPDNGLRLVLAGDGPRSLIDDLRTCWTSSGLESDRLVHLGHVLNEELASLYRQAQVLVQPSFMEGFGLTALEAIHCGTPVAAARAGALPEVVGFDELLFDPSSPEDLARVLVQLIHDPKETRRLMRKVQAHAARFTWERTASIAVERISALVQQNRTTSGLPALRKRVASMLDRKGLDLDAAARSFALSEPMPPSESRFLIDVTSTARIDHKTGIQRVVKNICSALADRSEREIANRHFIFCDDRRGWFSIDGRRLEKPQKDGATSLVPGRDTLLMLDSSWEFHALHRCYLRACRLRGGEVISCLYDTVPLRAPAFCDPGMPIVFSDWFCAALVHSIGFVCISRSVADELHHILQAISFPRRMKIGYWHLGADFVDVSDRTVAPVCRSNDKSRPLFLMVGTLEPRKGHRVALEAFEQLWDSGVDADLVIVGKKGWGVEALARRLHVHPEHGRRLTWHERVDDATLATLYESCDALIAASYSEGFGLPLVEAGQFGKPVIASDIPVFREVGAGAASATYFQVGSPEALVAAIRKFLQPRRTKAVKTSRVSWPNWHESAAQLEKVVLGGNWYRIYEPAERKDYISLDNLGCLRMDAPLAPEERAYALQLVEGPDLIDGECALKITVAVRNLSSVVWSSRGVADGTMSVNLSYHILDGDGIPLHFDNPRTAIPLVHIPGDTLYMAVRVPADWKERGAAFVDIELVQEGVAWFGDALRVEL